MAEQERILQTLSAIREDFIDGVRGFWKTRHLQKFLTKYIEKKLTLKQFNEMF